MAALKCLLVSAALAISLPAAARPLGPVEADRLRISTHLERVEQELRAKDVSSLSPELAAERQRNIERLRRYRLRGEFPHNTRHPGERVPYFIDRDGRTCAVAQLIVDSGERELAEEISSRENNARVKAMTTAGLTSWVKTSGLSVDECAQIQPGYCDETLCAPDDQPVCAKSGTSYLCLDVLEQCTAEEYAYDGECTDGGEPDAGLVVVTSNPDDGSDGCGISDPERGTGSPAALAALFGLAGLLRRRYWRARATRVK